MQPGDPSLAQPAAPLSARGPDVSVIIVNWNSKDYLRVCLQSLARHLPAALTLEVVVVDGGSYDGVDRMLAAEFPSVRFVQSPDNIGFARANNLGARHATGRSLLLLNPDTELIEDSISVLQGTLASSPDIGAVGCKLLNSDRSLQTSCVLSFPTVLNQVLDADYLRRRFPQWKLWGIAPLYASPPETAQVEALSGACIFISRETFFAIDGFTESYFMYGEDVDLCFKVKRHGLSACYTPHTSIIHFGGGSSSRSVSDFSTLMMRRSIYWYLRLNSSLTHAIAYRIFMTLAAFARLLLITPALMFGNRLVPSAKNAFKKWIAILRWGIGLTPNQKT